MSQENVEIVQSVCQAFIGDAGRSNSNWRDWLERMSKTLHPEIVGEPSDLGVPDIEESYVGIEAFLEFWEDWFAAWDTLQFDYEIVEAPDERVVLLIQAQTMRGRSSGVEIPMGQYAQVFSFRDGLVVRWRLYRDQAEALEAVGLSV